MDLTFHRTYPHPVAAVWQALTDQRAIRQWWLDTDFEPVAGREFYFQDKPQGGWDGRVTGSVLAVDAPRLVRFTWVGSGVDSTVEYRLAETASSGTEFTLVHRGFSGVRGLAIGTMLRFGWRGYVRRDVPAYAAHISEHGIDIPFPQSSKARRQAAAAGDRPGSS